MRTLDALVAAGSLLAAAAVAAGEPCKPVAKIADTRICAEDVGSDAVKLRDAMWLPLFEEYAKRKGLLPTQNEIQRLSVRFDEMRPPGGEPSEYEGRFIRSLLLNWKVGRDLHRQHGGRVMLSSFGLRLPVDALQAYLKEQERLGSFEIYDKKLRKTFLEGLKAEEQGDGVVGEEEGRRIYETPPWEQKVR